MNEREIIDMLAGMTGNRSSDLICGIGDDCAVIKKDANHSLLVTMDTLVESVHFNLDWHPSYLLGCKSVAVNVSDIAAMGGRPLFVFLSLGLPSGYDPHWLKDFGRGVVETCSRYGAVLSGGDTVRSMGGISMTLTVIGEALTDDIVYRSGARTGDGIWVSGVLGSAAAGLELCRRGKQSEKQFKDMIQAHLNPQPRVDLGVQLAKEHLVSSMMDLSDGLATDLAHICRRSGTGALIDQEKLPHDNDLDEAARFVQLDVQDMMISGGEDYELLFTAEPGRDTDIEGLAAKSGMSLTRVGTIDDRQGVRMVGRNPEGNPVEIDIGYRGYDHFITGLPSNDPI